jgi:hypothetical protein
MASLRFLTELSAEVLVPLEGNTPQELRSAVLRAQRAFGQQGWRCCPLPPGGFLFPLANEPDFDWRLLGARRGACTVEGEERDGVWYAGHFYTRRALDPNPRMKLGRAIKYSRGARSTDPAEGVEGEGRQCLSLCDPGGVPGGGPEARGVRGAEGGARCIAGAQP